MQKVKTIFDLRTLQSIEIHVLYSRYFIRADPLIMWFPDRSLDSCVNTRLGGILALSAKSCPKRLISHLLGERIL